MSFGRSGSGEGREWGKREEKWEGQGEDEGEGKGIGKGNGYIITHRNFLERHVSMGAGSSSPMPCLHVGKDFGRRHCEVMRLHIGISEVG